MSGFSFANAGGLLAPLGDCVCHQTLVFWVYGKHSDLKVWVLLYDIILHKGKWDMIDETILLTQLKSYVYQRRVEVERLADRT